MIRITSAGRLLLALFCLASSVAARAQELEKLPYVPTPQIVVDEMLKLAAVNEKDFVVDLGSGDGRMIITAARTFKANGLGVDIDATLVELATRHARNEAVSDRAKFIEQDMFKADISKATVVTLYVLPDFMEKLRPKLMRELKPGARIVAHDYYMSEWRPDRFAEMDVPEKKAANGTEKAYLYLWTVPAIVQGDWRMNWDFGDGKPQLIVLAFNQRYQMINASAASKDGEMKIANASLKGDDIDFFLTVGAANYRFTGKVQGERMSGNAVTATGGKPIPWSAAKMPPEK
ncbi:MAG TPA: class I SAM-dependent methyltransferase [Candidatus Limnocylindria bacterium]|nr:class I SAM-dependent methyltransferase [Candidatus Limnocylindria bacterium]